MASVGALLNKRRFLPLFVTQLLGAFNDNLYKNAMVLFVVYTVYNDETAETWFSAIATAVFILPFFLLSALAGQLADTRDKARIIRIVKLCEIFIMLVGGTGLYMAWAQIAVHTIAIPLMMLALFAMGIHSTFFGPIKYAILPQHLNDDEVLGGTGLVEAGTYIAILLGTILAGWIPVEVAGVAVVITAIIGYFTGRQVPPAPPMTEATKLDFNFIRASIALIRATMKVRRVFLAIIAISFFWTIGAVLFIQFPPLAKNVLTASKEVASLFLVVFSVGVAIGSVAINALLKGTVSARYSPASVIVMGLFVVAFFFVCRQWVPDAPGSLFTVSEFVSHSDGDSAAAGAARHCGRRRHVRGTALCLPHHDRAQERSRADDRSQQHRQFRRDGGRLADRDRAQPGGDRRDLPAAAERCDVRGGGLARPSVASGQLRAARRP